MIATGDDCKENLGLPKVPARKLSSHKSVVQYKKSKFEADDRNNINMAKPQQYGLPLHKVKLDNLNKDIKVTSAIRGLRIANKVYAANRCYSRLVFYARSISLLILSDFCIV